MAHKLSNSIIGCLLWGALACGSPSGAPLFAKCEGAHCLPTSPVSGSAQGGLAAAGELENKDPGAAGARASGDGAAGNGAALASSSGGALENGGFAHGAGAEDGGGASQENSFGSSGSVGGSDPAVVSQAGSGEPGGVSGCVSQVGSLSALSIFGADGVNGVCSLRLAPPRTGVWFTLDDGSLSASPASNISARQVATSDGGCFVLGTGAGATNWGGGIAFVLDGDAASPCAYDGSAYRGLLIYLRGTTNATQGPNYQTAPNTVRVNVMTTATSDAYGTCLAANGKCNDHFGVWCTLGSTWTRCEVPFDNLSQRGWGAVSHFDKAELLEIQILAVRQTTVSAAASWHIEADDVTFYP